MTISQTPVRPSLEGVITINGPLAQTVPQLQLETVWHADQITNARRTDEPMRNQWFYVADGAMYALEGKTQFLFMTRGYANPVLNNIGEAASQLLTSGNYIPSSEEIVAAHAAPDTLKINLLGLKAKNDGGEFSYFTINTQKPQLSGVQRPLAERIYGRGDDFGQNMKMLAKAGISETRVYVLNPDYVNTHVQQGRAIARACRLRSFGLDSVFYAYGRIVDYRIALRGVRRAEVAAEGGVPQIDYRAIAQSLQLPGFDPSQLGRELNSNGVRALTAALTYVSPKR